MPKEPFLENINKKITEPDNVFRLVIVEASEGSKHKNELKL